MPDIYTKHPDVVRSLGDESSRERESLDSSFVADDPFSFYSKNQIAPYLE